MSSSIITSLFWVRKNWARSIPLEYERTDDKQYNKISKVAQKWKQEGKWKGTETIKEETKIIEDNWGSMNIDDEAATGDIVFTEDLKKYYDKKTTNDNMEIEGSDNLPDEFESVPSDEEEDFTIHPKDSLIVCGTAQDDFSNIEVYIYDEENMSWFVHHDIVWSSFPLSLEWLPYKNNNKANYAFVGSFTPEIEIWNWDIMDVIEPELILGAGGKNNTTNNTGLVHEDAVISLNLNPINSNILASCGADKKILLWDLNSTPEKAGKSFLEHTDKVQSVRWNKQEDNILISGSFDKTIKLYDVRANKSSTTININSDIECLEWSAINKYLFLSSYENGRINWFDIRKFETVLSFQAHKKEATSVSFSNQQESLFCSVGRDSRIKVWDSATISSDKEGNYSPSIIMEKFVKKSTGELFSCKFCEDTDYTIAVGGSKGELFIWQLEESPIFCSKYGLKFEDNVPVKEEYNNIAKRKKMANKRSGIKKSK